MHSCALSVSLTVLYTHINTHNLKQNKSFYKEEVIWIVTKYFKCLIAIFAEFKIILWPKGKIFLWMTNLLPWKPGLRILNKNVNALRNAIQANTLYHQLEVMYVLVLSLISLWLWDSRDGGGHIIIPSLEKHLKIKFQGSTWWNTLSTCFGWGKQWSSHFKG